MLTLPLQIVTMILNKKIFFVDLSKIVCFSQSAVDYAPEGFYDVTYQRFSVIKKCVVYSAKDIEAVKRKQAFNEIKKISVANIKQ